MPAFLLSEKALEDLKSIGRYAQKTWGREQRNKYLLKLDESFHILSRQAQLGTARDDIRKGYRVYHVGRHLIFYRPKTTKIQIIRILHDRMNVESHLKRR